MLLGFIYKCKRMYLGSEKALDILRLKELYDMKSWDITNSKGELWKEWQMGGK